MKKIQSEHFEIVRPLFAELASFNGSLDAVLARTARGEVYVDDIEHPQIGFASASEGHYLAGKPAADVSYEALKEIIPARAYLIFTEAAWENRLGEIGLDKVARKHERQYLRFQAQKIGNWRELIPEGFQLARVDEQFLARTELVNHQAIADWVGGWDSTDYFLQYGFGFCLIHDGTIASWCVADCANGDKCEIGITTDMDYRQRGLAAIVVAAAVEHALEHGFTEIGWHCLKSNSGSIGVGEKVGFAKVREYFAYSSLLPTENVNDMTRAEYEDWAQHYERFVEQGAGYHFRAAEAWALAGNAESAMQSLRQFVDKSGAKLLPQWVDKSWRLVSLRGMAEFEALIERGE